MGEKRGRIKSQAVPPTAAIATIFMATILAGPPVPLILDDNPGLCATPFESVRSLCAGGSRAAKQSAVPLSASRTAWWLAQLDLQRPCPSQTWLPSVPVLETMLMSNATSG